MTRRPGLTMTELLIAIFIVAIGLAGVMSMVPFGAKQMADALVADRTTSHADTIDGLVRTEWNIKVADNLIDAEPYFAALDNPGTPPSTGTALPALSGSSLPSYPVFLDSMGFFGRVGSNNQQWVGDGNGTAVPRRNMSVCNSAQLALRMWSQADGFTWDEDSVPRSGPDMRELRYNALAVIQRPVNQNRYSATFKVVVFSNRRHLFYPAGSEASFDLPPPNATTPPLNPGDTQLQLPLTADVKKGSWLMDGTVVANSGSPIRHANFYRVVSVTNNGSTDVNGVPVWDIELHAPITRADGGTGRFPVDPATGLPATAKIIVMPGVAAVFERPRLEATPGN